MNKHKMFNLVLVLVFVFSLGGIPRTSVFAEESSPYIQAFPDQDRVNANNWPMDTVVTMTVNGSYTYTSKAGQSSWDPDGTTAGFDIRSHGLKAGDAISMTGGGITRSMTVTALQITNIDVSTSTVSGTADADKQVYVWVNGAGGMWLTPNPDGTWIADFAPFSFVPGTEGGATQPDAAGNTTQTGWHTLNPVIQAFPDQDKVNANDWPIGTVVSMTINGSNTYTARVGASSWDPYGTTAEIWVENHDVQAGDAISMTGGGITRSMIITSLKITGIDVNNATVSGVADADKVFHVWVNGGSDFYITPGANGAWTADFKPFVFVPGTKGGAQQTDEFGNYTQIDWSVPSLPSPSLEIDVTTNSAYTSDWLVGTDVTISFDDPGNGTGWDYSKTVEVPPGWGGWCQFIINIDPNVFRIQAGQVVKITDGTTTRQSTIPLLTVEAVDQAADTISGYTRAAGTVNVQAYYMTRPGSGTRNPIADGSGYWFADFGHAGIGNEWETFDVDGSQGFFWVSIPGDDYVSAKFQWGLGPVFNVFQENAQVTTSGWPYDVELTLTIDDPSTGVSPDLTRTQLAQEGNMGWGSEAIFENLDAILPGFIVSITDGTVFKTHTVTPLAVTGINLDTDTVSGTAEPGSQVEVGWICDDNGCAYRSETAVGGNWVADFSQPGDGGDEQDLFNIKPGTESEARQPDEDGDATTVRWVAPNPPAFSVLPYDDSIEGNEWPLDSTLTIEIGDLNNPDYSITTSVNPPDQDHNQTWFKLELANIFDLQPGQIVTVFDTTTTKQAIIVPRNITMIDPVADIIAGEAESNIVNVVLWACDDNGCGARYKDVNPDGSWSVNFAEPGEQGWENVIVDIQPDTTGGIYQGDADGDGTTYLEWSVRNQMPVANAGPDRIIYAGETISLDASASSDPEAGTLTYAWDLDNDGQYDDASGVTVNKSFIQPGDHVIGLQVTDNGGLSDTDTATVTVLPWTLKGFYQPVDMNGVYNLVKGGSTVPLKFEVLAGSTELTDITYVKSLTYALTTCNADVITDEIELTATGGTSLRYAGGHFIYNWKTPKTAGKCYRVTLITLDGTSLVAYFKLK